MSVSAGTIDAQRLASDPARSVFVAANAGSGKTHVLTERVVRLLLAGAEPSKILCLTYTKAAAAEMQTRVFRRLAEWAVMDEAALGEAVASLTGRRADDAALAQARRLFARALETPGGLKIQTIHAFCEAVLHQFPIEANIPGRFEVLDDATSAILLAEARRALVGEASGQAGRAGADGPLAVAFADALSLAGEWGLDTLIGEIVSKRDRLRRHLESVGGLEGAERVLTRALGVSAADTPDTLLASLGDPAPFDQTFRAEVLRAADGSGKPTDAKLAENLRRFEAAERAAARLEILQLIVLTQSGGRRKPSSVATKAVIERFPDFAERLEALAELLDEASERLATWRLARASLAALTIAERFERDYATLKRRRGQLDFEDLIVRTADLLLRSEAAAWVHFKLDQGIDHVLVDEAQDTSPRQWEVVRQLVEEFFAGASARRAPRTLFAVGDEKQSIYSFQGASPAMFAAQRAALQGLAEAAELPFSRVELHQSFRSVPAVLEAVDEVFGAAETRRGLSSGNEAPVHVSARANDPGLVEIWPAVQPAARTESADWLDPVDLEPESSPANRLARRIAGQIKAWLGQPVRARGGVRPITPGDVLVLVRKRSGFVSAMGAALRAEGIAVAGADRLVITDHIAVQDLMALGRTVSNAEDELSLAAVLKSPLFGFTDGDLMALALSRGGERRPQSLYLALRRLARKGGEERIPPFVAEPAARAKLRERAALAFERLEELRRRIGFESVFTFYSRILGPEGGRARLAARLGRDAGDVVDAFLDLALAEEAAGRDGIDAFLADLALSPPEIKREMEHGRGEVRIMTTHASKGLEAPVVFLVDPGSAPFSHAHSARLIEWTDMPGLVPGTPPGFLWCPEKGLRNAVVRGLQDTERERAEDEYRRLLYVGMTRAADRLVICGTTGVRAPDPQTWLQRAETALRRSARRILDADGEPVGWRLGADPDAGTVAAEPSAPPAPPRRIDLSPLPPEPPPPRPLSPSTASGGALRIEIERAMPGPGGASPVLGGGEDAASGIRRGQIAHRLLEALPSLEGEERAAAAGRYLALMAPGWSEEARETLLGQVLAVLDDARFAPFFAPGSRAEVGIVGAITLGDRPYTVNGAIDRLAVAADGTVHLLDYKTDRPVPQGPGEVPESYRLQLALYRELLRPLYPGRPIRAALLFTEGPSLVDIDDALMDEALRAREARGVAARAT